MAKYRAGEEVDNLMVVSLWFCHEKGLCYLKIDSPKAYSNYERNVMANPA